MPKLTKKLTTYRKHKRSGQVIVNLSGQDHYLGPLGSKASRAFYSRVLGSRNHTRVESPDTWARN